MAKYNPKAIEKKWQNFWEENQTFRTDDDFSKPKYYVLDMIPYPSGAGLHVGHPEGYTATDIIARFKRMNGFNVLHPMGWDAFGLPTERAAERENRHPAEITKDNTANFKRQMQDLGLSYDWNRAIDTTSPDYYKWTQWLFLKLYECDLAYLAEVPVNWCPAQGTVLSNEEVKDGKYIETGDPIERKLVRQWMLKITDYADKLLEGLDDLDWPEGIVEMQRKWIGRTEGAKIKFSVDQSGETLDIFTAKPETVFGATYCMIAPEHPAIGKISTEAQESAVAKYVSEARQKSDMDRKVIADKEKTGVFTGSYAINPLTGEKIQIWVSDAVTMDFGTGAEMQAPDYEEKGTFQNSGFLTGLDTEQAREKIIHWLEENNLGGCKTAYKLKDWLFSRQRYWGEPFPLLHRSDGKVVPVPEDCLPVTLPSMTDFKPTADGQSPLTRVEDWLKVEMDDETLLRETNTMPQWAGSCWYYLRFMDPHNDQEPFNSEAEKYWGPVDLYVGGVEHAVLHLLYARFWHKVMYDIGLVSTKEPFQKLFNQGMVLGVSYKDDKGEYYHADDVEQRGKQHFVKGTAIKLTSRVEKMSKSKLNVVNPDDIIQEYGADALRLYEMFMGPIEAVKPWRTSDIKGVHSFLNKTWELFIDSKGDGLSTKIKDIPEEEASQDLLHELALTINKVTTDIEGMRFNTAIARMMGFVNMARKEPEIPCFVAKEFVKLLSPFAPHIAEELWLALGHDKSIAYEFWPEDSDKWIAEENLTLSVYFNKAKRATVCIDPSLSSKEEVLAAVSEDSEVKKLLENVVVKDTIYVSGKLVKYVL